MDVAYGAADYAIQIPANHPSGHFWFHPHIHGVALNQVTAGLSGIITIGSPADMCADATCTSQVKAGNVRHLTLKDMQILPNGAMNTQEEPTFCGDPPTGSPQGFCAAFREATSITPVAPGIIPSTGRCFRPLTLARPGISGES